jgi:hypothetical protein
MAIRYHFWKVKSVKNQLAFRGVDAEPLTLTRTLWFIQVSVKQDRRENVTNPNKDRASRYPAILDGDRFPSNKQHPSSTQLPTRIALATSIL